MPAENGIRFQGQDPMTQADFSDDVQPYQLHKTVVLVGMMGSGKTAIGRALAARLDVAFLDSDAAIEEAATATIAEIFARDGEAFFRKREAEVIERLLTGPPAILSTGGGAFLSDKVRKMIDDHGVAVWLDAKLGTLWERVRHKDTRPLLRTANPRQTLSDIFDARGPIYAQARLRLPITAASSIDDTTTAAIDLLAQYPDTLERTP